MNTKRALEIISALSDGVHPGTGELLPADSVCQWGDSVRALQISIDALQRRLAMEKRQSTLPSLNGRRWKIEEDQLLSQRYVSGMPVTEISQLHQRSVGAVVARLVRLGKVDLDQPAIRVASSAAVASHS